MLYPVVEEKLTEEAPARYTCPLHGGLRGECIRSCAWLVRGRCAVAWLAERAAREALR